MENINYFIFDFDGTLGDTKRTIVNCFLKTIKESGKEERKENEIVNTIGKSLEESFKILYPEINESECLSLADLYRKYYDEVATKSLVAYPHLEEVFSSLKKMDKKIAIFSSRRVPMIKRLATALKIDKYVDAYVGNDLIKNGKPDPEGVYLTLKLLDAKKDESIMIGDTYFDIKMANNAKIKSIFANYGYGNISSLKEAKFDYQISDLKEILDLKL